MSLAPAEKTVPVPAPSGGVHFVTSARHGDLCGELRARRYLVAPVAPPERGRLRHAIDEAVEGALALRGALPPAVHLDAALEPTIRDQIFRARALGAAGLCLTVPAVGGDTGVLDAADSETLLAWLTAARRAPLLLVLDEADRAARVLAPVAIAEIVGPSPLATVSDSVPPSGEIEAAPEAMRTPPPPVIAMPRRGVMKKRSLRLEAPLSEPDAAPAALHKAAALMPAVPPLEAAPPPPPVEEEIEPDPPTTPRPPRVMVSPAAPPAERPRLIPRTMRPRMEPVVVAPEPEPVVEEQPEPPPPAAPSARRVIDGAEYRTHAMELDKARGPKPVAVIERLFSLRYAPLLGGVARGDADAAVRGVVDTWRASFENSYRDAFSALRVTGKRPPMVFDAPDIAARIGRLNGARATKLCLVDAMRFDVGERVAERLKDKLVGRAVLVERMLLWSALPTTTPTNLALLGRGADGLRDAEPTSEPEPEITRGRAVSTLRRERVGSREVMKLDLVEARLRNAGPAYDERLDALAEEVTPILVKFIETLPPRTLLFLFGDHGFRLPASPDGKTTGAATQGGTSPEEVLVPGQAWLVGGVH
jgi:hypothetical protein